jgi:oligopeptide transport system permease protein
MRGEPQTQPPEAERGSSLWHDAWLRMRANRVAMLSLFLLIGMIIACFGLAWFLGDPNKIDLENRFGTPGDGGALGTDKLGRDMLARILYGGQISILVGLVSALIATTIGVAYGAVSGFAGGRTDAVMMRIVDTLLAIPFLVVVIVLQAVLSDSSKQLSAWLVENWSWDKGLTDRILNIVPLFIALGAFGWLTLARIVRAQVMSLKESEFVEAATSLGLSRRRILFRHIIPNTLGPVIVYTTLGVPSFIMYEASLSYLGLGIEAPNSSWGILIQEGANFLETQPLLLVIPGLFFSATLLALNFFGDGLRDALDVKASKD